MTCLVQTTVFQCYEQNLTHLKLKTCVKTLENKIKWDKNKIISSQYDSN